MIERHWDGIAAYCRPENKIALGFVEGLNNKIRVLQSRAYACATKNISSLKSWRRACQSYEKCSNPPTKKREEPLFFIATKL